MAPGAGEHFYVLDDIAQAREIAELAPRHERSSVAGRAGYQHVTLENLFDRLDRHGRGRRRSTSSCGPTCAARSKRSRRNSRSSSIPRCKIKLLQASVGGITEADVTLADASDAIIIGFNVVPDEKARIAGREDAACRFAATT